MSGRARGVEEEPHVELAELGQGEQRAAAVEVHVELAAELAAEVVP
jgi:hypothetical protein